MTINAGGLKAGMHLSMSRVYVRVERITREHGDMVRAYVRSVTGALVPVLFHADESLTVGA
ncbi:hypothetical protein ABZX73_17190 [Brevibacterium casei]